MVPPAEPEPPFESPVAMEPPAPPELQPPVAPVAAEPPPAPPVSKKAPGARAEGIDLGAWQKKFTGYVSNPASAISPVSGAGATSAPDASGEEESEVQGLRLEWNQFIESVQKGGEPILATHLQSCQIASCSAKGVLEIVSCRKFSCEELLQEAELLGRKLSEFYRRTLKVRIRYDAERDACTREKSVFDLFGELTRKNEVVRYIVTEFGGELIY